MRSLDWVPTKCLQLSLWLISSFVLAGCSATNVSLFELSGQTMGTTYRLTYASSENREASLKEEVEQLLRAINQSLSPFIESSLISRINASRDTAQTFAIDRHFEIVFQHAQYIHDLTNGAFNPALGPLIRAWGFGKDEPRTLDSTEVNDLLQFTSLEIFSFEGDDPPRLRKQKAEGELDFGAIAKGHAVDELGALLESVGIFDYLVEIGGEVRARGSHPENRSWRVGIEKPLEASRDLQVIVNLSDISMATSGNYRNYYWTEGRKIVHTLNPLTGYPEDNSLLSVSVIAKNCMTADAFATAFMVLGRDRTLEFVERNGGPDVYLISGSDEEAWETSTTDGFSRLIETETEF
ncbi:MAG: FAD:protein FMN transferase [Rhodothermia bacterium]|nr:MAG: FAD:protein FMN transferase [Rhodothermia bacterium]